MIKESNMKSYKIVDSNTSSSPSLLHARPMSLLNCTLPISYSQMHLWTFHTSLQFVHLIILVSVTDSISHLLLGSWHWHIPGFLPRFFQIQLPILHCPVLFTPPLLEISALSNIGEHLQQFVASPLPMNYFVVFVGLILHYVLQYAFKSSKETEQAVLSNVFSCSWMRQVVGVSKTFSVLAWKLTASIAIMSVLSVCLILCQLCTFNYHTIITLIECSSKAVQNI